MKLKIGETIRRVDFFFGGLKIASVVTYTAYGSSYKDNIPTQEHHSSVYLKIPFAEYSPSFETEQAAIDELGHTIGDITMMNSLIIKISESSDVKEHAV